MTSRQRATRSAEDAADVLIRIVAKNIGASVPELTNLRGELADMLQKIIAPDIAKTNELVANTEHGYKEACANALALTRRLEVAQRALIYCADIEDSTVAQDALVDLEVRQPPSKEEAAQTSIATEESPEEAGLVEEEGLAEPAPGVIADETTAW